MIKGFNHNRMALFKLFISTEKKRSKKAHWTLHIQHKCFIPVQSGILYTSNLYKVLLHPANSTDKVFICLGFSLKEMCFVSITGEEERGERCFLQIGACFICQETEEQYKPFPTLASSSLAASLSPSLSKCHSFSFHRSSCRPSGLNIDRMNHNNHSNLLLKRLETKIHT